MRIVQSAEDYDFVEADPACWWLSGKRSDTLDGVAGQ